MLLQRLFCFLECAFGCLFAIAIVAVLISVFLR